MNAARSVVIFILSIVVLKIVLAAHGMSWLAVFLVVGFFVAITGASVAIFRACREFPARAGNRLASKVSIACFAVSGTAGVALVMKLICWC